MGKRVDRMRFGERQEGAKHHAVRLRCLFELIGPRAVRRRHQSISHFQSPSDNDTLTPINQIERERIPLRVPLSVRRKGKRRGSGFSMHETVEAEAERQIPLTLPKQPHFIIMATGPLHLGRSIHISIDSFCTPAF